ncbi:MAG: saccharopine dehydrogenase [Bacteroidetes bacterium GWC2_33_15]|nr:MAG: saccharopine dehydrogenase [Bacteroidetes bacterium GWA2_33_15]OFX52547.1 MAG: saccharopine dehydrogenase [Bacteroidetes bacterium GWC2_33_15]OFX63892.1 MAG: saccharopine dehydrogenase [Bacteroidetes bacterium GWB2_32_14]OFX70841.1 MAG: saccharopine dehydrogenase [Bacteroidetes bacterium GWD2_33_33]HAN19970.1 saccharopine dehydrogenase [Bacteroidales bacterium]
MKKIAVLGAGLVGKAIAIDLAKSFDVTSIDINPSNLEKLQKYPQIKTIIADLSDKEEFQDVVKNVDLIIGSLPGYMGYECVKQAILAGKDIIDISFFRQDPFELDELAKKQNVTAIIDAGVSPGMGNIILGYHNANMKVNSYKCYGGGLPFKREWPYEYKAVFSPIDVLEEYIGYARYILHGELVEREALSEAELKHFEPIGSLEAWNSDGLRTMLKTIKIPNMIEKTLRYPGTIEYIKVLKETGFFSDKEILVDGYLIRPIDVTAKLLFPVWELKKDEEDFTMMRVIIKGDEKGEEIKYTYDLFDKYDKETDTTSMARTTGYTCTAIANLFAKGMIKQKGICPPEYIGVDEKNFKFILDYLKERGVEYKLIKE